VTPITTMNAMTIGVVSLNKAVNGVKMFVLTQINYIFYTISELEVTPH
jgi:hypothetical protein